jgi:hypothetical protein
MDAKKQFAEGKFKAECSQMVLTNDGNPQFAIAGPGEIWQDEDGVLRFKTFINRDDCVRLNAYMGRPGVIGQLIPDGDYFTLQAQEYSLPRWTAPRVMPSPRSGPAGGFAHGYLHELVQTEAYPANPEFDYVTLRLREKLDFPCNQGTETVIRVGGQDRHTSSSLNAAFIDDGDYRFELIHEHEHTFVSLQLPAGQLSAATASRIREALQFVLGRQVAVMVVETSTAGQHTTRLTSPSKGHGNIPPPLMFDRLDQGGHVWRMFTNYVRCIFPNAACGFHPISKHIGSTVESTAASLDAEVLALAVSVEGLVGESFPNLAPVNQAFLTELDSIQNSLRAIVLEGSTRNRVEGSLNAMRRARNSDLLRAFLNAYRMPAGLYDSWSRLRNTSAHGGGAGDRDIETTLRLKNEVLSLLYSIVFAAVNYTGPRTDYSLPGWPTRAWPIPQPPAAPPAPAPAASAQVSAPVAVPPQVTPVAVAPPIPSPPAPTATTRAPTNPAPPEPPNPAST